MVLALCCRLVVIVCVLWNALGDDKCDSYNLASVVALVVQVKAELKAEQGKMQNTINAQANKIVQMERTIETLEKDKIEQMERTIETLEKNNQAVGFSVNEISNVSSGVVTFSNAVINTDQAYNLTTGAFTCRTPGHYYFFFSLGKKSSFTAEAWCYIRKNGETLVYGITESDVYSPVVTSVYVRLVKGDTVALEGCTESAWTTSFKSSSFTGFLVKPDV